MGRKISAEFKESVLKKLLSRGSKTLSDIANECGLGISTLSRWSRDGDAEPQKNGKMVSYKVIAKYKFEKRDRFKVAVLLDGNKIATADDFNKKSAEQMASEKALIGLGIITEEEETED